MTTDRAPAVSDRLDALTRQLREAAGKATPRRWYVPEALPSNIFTTHGQFVACADRTDGHANAKFIAAMDPSFALALADVVEGVARRHQRVIRSDAIDPDAVRYGCSWCLRCWPCPEVTAFDPVCDLLLGTGKEQR